MKKPGRKPKLENREEIVKEYLTNNLSLREMADKYGVHYGTIANWVRWYRENGTVEKPSRSACNEQNRTSGN